MTTISEQLRRDTNEVSPVFIAHVPLRELRQEAADTIDALVAALEAYDFYAGLPADRGGKNGPKGMSFAGFIAEKDAALALARGESGGK